MSLYLGRVSKWQVQTAHKYFIVYNRESDGEEDGYDYSTPIDIEHEFKVTEQDYFEFLLACVKRPALDNYGAPISDTSIPLTVEEARAIIAFIVSMGDESNAVDYMMDEFSSWVEEYWGEEAQDAYSNS